MKLPKYPQTQTQMQTRVDSVGFTFDFESSDWLDVWVVDMAAEFPSLEGQLSGVGQLEMTSWQFNPDEDEDEEGNEREISRLSHEFQEQIVEDALEEMFESRGVMPTQVSDSCSKTRSAASPTTESPLKSRLCQVSGLVKIS